jgi:phospholipase C
MMWARALGASVLFLTGCAVEPGDSASSESADTEARSCAFRAGASPRATIPGAPTRIPIEHVIIVIQENRSFDHMLGSLAREGRDVDGIPAGFVNTGAKGETVHFEHRTDTCFEADSPHNEEAMESSIDGDKMDSFVASAAKGGSDGHYVMSYYTRAELPFYYFLADRFAISDRYFAPMIGPTDPNRDFMYAATSNGVTVTASGTNTPMKGVHNIYDALDAKKISWGVYSSGAPRQGAIGWDRGHKGVHDEHAFFEALEDDTLPAVVFVDPGLNEDEHPPHDVQLGEQFSKKIYDAVTKSKAWNKTALFYTYDEAGGIADHVSPPSACAPSASLASFDRLGVRVPVTLVSPYAKRGYVSHETHSHTSILRFVELVWDVPALTARDANADAMLDMFDFDAAPASAPIAPSAGTGACKGDPSRNFITDTVQKVGNWWDRITH